TDDTVGYFRAPNGSGGQFFKQGGNAFGGPALLGTTDDFMLDVLVHNGRVMRFQPTEGSPNITGGHPNNQSSPVLPGQVVAGGGDSATNCYEPSDGSSTRNCRNRTAGDFATISGGGGNLVDNIWGTIAGGESNNASAYATVGGGLGNRALGQYSVVPGGRDNLAFGTASVALGQRAQADYDGCFVFGDGSTPNVVQCNERDRFVVRATHGIFMFTG